jgi:hypothetical protein
VLVAILFPPLFEMKLALSRERRANEHFKEETKVSDERDAENEAARVTVLLARGMRLAVNGL